MRILWICDIEGWAFDRAARNMSARMPDDFHEFFYSKHGLPLGLLRAKAEVTDVVMCNHPAQIGWLDGGQGGKVVLRFASRPFKLERPNVCWLCDMPGWAYERRARQMIKSLDRYNHTILYYHQFATDKQRTAAVAGFDAVICLCVAYAQLVENRKRAIGCVGGLRLLYGDGCTER